MDRRANCGSTTATRISPRRRSNGCGSSSFAEPAVAPTAGTRGRDAARGSASYAGPPTGVRVCPAHRGSRDFVSITPPRRPQRCNVGSIRNGADIPRAHRDSRLRPEGEVSRAQSGAAESAADSWIRKCGGLRLRLLDRSGVSRPACKHRDAVLAVAVGQTKAVVRS